MKILTVGLGTGHKQVLLALSSLKRLLPQGSKPFITASPGVADRGGFTRLVREARPDWPAISDCGQCIEGLHPDSEMRKKLAHRLELGPVKGMTLRNSIILASFEEEERQGRVGPSQKAFDDIMLLLNLHGRIVPPTFSATDLKLELMDGTLLKNQHEANEANILAHGDMRRAWLEPVPAINPDFVTEAAQANLLIVCPGGMHEQLFLIPGVIEALRASRAVKVCIANIANTLRRIPADETAAKHVSRLEVHLGEGFFDWVIQNNKLPSPEQEAVFSKNERLVPLSRAGLARRKVLRAPLLADDLAEATYADAIQALRSCARHDPPELAKALRTILIREGLVKVHSQARRT